MFTYEGGLVLALLIWLYHAIHLLVSINSQIERNLNRIGQRLSWLTLSPKPMDAGDLKRSAWSRIGKYLFVVGIGLPFVLLSWISVVWSVGVFIFFRVKDSGAPQAVREFRWKMRNADLTFDQIIKELMKVEEVDPTTFQTYRSNYVRGLQERGLSYDGKIFDQGGADEIAYWEYRQKHDTIRAKYDPGNTWNEATALPPEYRKEIATLNLEYQEMLRRRNGWTDQDF